MSDNVRCQLEEVIHYIDKSEGVRDELFESKEGDEMSLTRVISTITGGSTYTLRAFE